MFIAVQFTRLYTDPGDGSLAEMQYSRWMDVPSNLISKPLHELFSSSSTLVSPFLSTLCAALRLPLGRYSVVEMADSLGISLPMESTAMTAERLSSLQPGQPHPQLRLLLEPVSPSQGPFLLQPEATAREPTHTAAVSTSSSSSCPAAIVPREMAGPDAVISSGVGLSPPTLSSVSLKSRSDTAEEDALEPAGKRPRLSAAVSVLSKASSEACSQSPASPGKSIFSDSSVQISFTLLPPLTDFPSGTPFDLPFSSCQVSSAAKIEWLARTVAHECGLVNGSATLFLGHRMLCSELHISTLFEYAKSQKMLRQDGSVPLTVRLDPVQCVPLVVVDASPAPMPPALSKGLAPNTQKATASAAAATATAPRRTISTAPGPSASRGSGQTVKPVVQPRPAVPAAALVNVSKTAAVHAEEAASAASSALIPLPKAPANSSPAAAGSIVGDAPRSKLQRLASMVLHSWTAADKGGARCGCGALVPLVDEAMFYAHAKTTSHVNWVLRQNLEFASPQAICKKGILTPQEVHRISALFPADAPAPWKIRGQSLFVCSCGRLQAFQDVNELVAALKVHIQKSIEHRPAAAPSPIVLDAPVPRVAQPLPPPVVLRVPHVVEIGVVRSWTPDFRDFYIDAFKKQFLERIAGTGVMEPVFRIVEKEERR